MCTCTRRQQASLKLLRDLQIKNRSMLESTKLLLINFPSLIMPPSPGSVVMNQRSLDIQDQQTTTQGVIGKFYEQVLPG